MKSKEKKRFEVAMEAVKKFYEIKGVSTPSHILVTAAMQLTKEMNKWDTDEIRVCTNGQLKRIFTA